MRLRLLDLKAFGLCSRTLLPRPRIPYAVDPPEGQRPGDGGASPSSRVHQPVAVPRPSDAKRHRRACAGGAGLLGSAWVDGRRDARALPQPSTAPPGPGRHPGAGTPPPEASGLKGVIVPKLGGAARLMVRLPSCRFRCGTAGRRGLPCARVLRINRGR